MKNGKIERTQEHAFAQVSPDTMGLMRRAYAKSTLECRRKILKKLDNWLQGREITDPILAEYMTHLFTQGNAPATIRNVSSTAKWVLKLKNKGKGVDLPICTANLAGICREGRDRGSGQRNGLTWRDVEKICAVQEADGTLMGLRNSAIIQVMSDAMLRVSELVELRVSDLQENMVQIRFSKTDQEGKGEYLYLCEDTRRVVQKWMDRAGITDTDGYLFRRITAKGDKIKKPNNSRPMTDSGVRGIVKLCAARVGLTDKISTHSMRIGSAISLAQAGATVVDMQIAGRWKDPGMPAYYARAQLSSQGAIARFKDGK